MSSPGRDAGRARPLDPNLAKALSHPLRQRILERLSEGDEASPNQLARVLDAPLGNVAYHVRVLHRLGFVELVRTGSAAEHSNITTAPWRIRGSTLSSGRSCRPRSAASHSRARCATSSPTRSTPASRVDSIIPMPKSGG